MDTELDREGFFSERAASEMLDQTVVESMVPDLPVLRMAYLIERDFAEFYESAAEKAEGEAKEALEMLARWERGHETFFRQLHDTAFEEYAQMPWGG
jgi:rubrerythrin